MPGMHRELLASLPLVVQDQPTPGSMEFLELQGNFRFSKSATLTPDESTGLPEIPTSIAFKLKGWASLGNLELLELQSNFRFSKSVTLTLDETTSLPELSTSIALVLRG